MARGVLLFKENDMRRALRAVKKEGVPVGRIVVTRDGDIEVIVGKPGGGPASAENEANDFD
jgi:hypothetical protein